MLENKLIDGIIKEPLGGAHANPNEAFENVKKEIIKQLTKLMSYEADKRVQSRIRKFSNMGVVDDQKSKNNTND
jgi:acetyl-CoA carboxylase carboxyl transferase subunit alpha